MVIIFTFAIQDIFPLPDARSYPTDHSAPIPAPGATLGVATWVPRELRRLSCANSRASVYFGSLTKYLWRVIRAERLNGDHCNVSN